MSLATQAYGPGGQTGFSWTGAVTASTVGPYNLNSGKYAFSCAAPSTSATLQRQMPDGSYITISTIGTSGGQNVLDLVAGNYQVTFVATSGVAGFVARIRHHGA